MGYMGCAIAALGSYGFMMVMSYFIGQHYYPVDYHMSHLLGYFGIAAVLYGIGLYALPALGLGDVINGLVRLLLLALFVFIFLRWEHLNLRSLIPHKHH